jgi:isocitrate lyase
MSRIGDTAIDATERITQMNYQPRGISDQALQGPASYASEIGAAKALLETQPTWNGVSAEAVARMRLQNRFKTGLDVARYTAALMRADMAAYDADKTKYTQSLGCWHGFIAQQKLISVKKHFGTTDRCYLYLSGWMIAALRSEFGPLPDQSMHETSSTISSAPSTPLARLATAPRKRR